MTRPIPPEPIQPPRMEAADLARAGSRRAGSRDLAIGSALVLLLLFVALAGPLLAPRDPMAQTFAGQTRQGRWIGPPFRVLQVEGFPLGTDPSGRDMFSRLLWGVRPTMLLVGGVVVLRLAAGTAIGLVAGWSTGRVGGLFESLIQGALAIPILLVALAVVAAFGTSIGAAAFLLGLGVTGWGETARLVAEQTQVARGQLYVEAARGLGAADLAIVRRHILRQIAPMLWMLVAFEFSSGLVVLAGLGFLGYYVGGGVWVTVDDFVALNVSGLPELGQMLAAARESLRDPWGMLTVGAVIFLAVLGFNLVGQGMQQRLELDRSRRNRRVDALAQEIENRVTDAVQPWLRRRGITPRRIFVGLGGMAAIVLFVLGTGRMTGRGASPRPVLVGNPGGHLWASERYNAPGTLWADVAGPSAPVAELVFTSEEGIVGGPSVAANGNLFVNLPGGLISVGPEGERLWEVTLEGGPVGAPALGEDGSVYVAQGDGSLSAFGPEGDSRWRHEIQGYGEATGGPVVGPGGVVLYTLDTSLQSVSSAGESLWRSPTESLYVYASPRVSAHSEWVFLKGEAFRADTGEPVDLRPAPAQGSLFQDPRFFVGADGSDYYLLGNSVLAWEASGAGVEVIRQAAWNSAAFVVNFPADGGVLPDGGIWLLYGGQFGDTRLVWLSPEGSLEGSSYDPFRLSRVIGLDRDSNLVWCGLGYQVHGLGCFSYPARSTTPLWQVGLGGETVAVGGALTPGRVYVATEGGSLYLLRDGP